MSINFSPARASVEALVLFAKDKTVAKAPDHKMLSLDYKDKVPFLKAVPYSEGTFINNLASNAWTEVTANSGQLQSIAKHLSEQNAKIFDPNNVHDNEWELLQESVKKLNREIVESNAKVSLKFIYPDIPFVAEVQIPKEAMERINKKKTEESKHLKETEDKKRVENLTTMKQVVTTLIEKPITQQVAAAADKQRIALDEQNKQLTTADEKYRTDFALFSLIVDAAKHSALGLTYTHPYSYDENALDGLCVRDGDSFYRALSYAIQKMAQGNMDQFVKKLACKDKIGAVTTDFLPVKQLRQAVAGWLKDKQADNNVEMLILNAALDYNHSLQGAIGRFSEEVSKEITKEITTVKSSLDKGGVDELRLRDKLNYVEQLLADNFSHFAFVKGLTEIKKQLIDSFNFQIWLTMKDVLSWPIIKNKNFKDLFLNPLSKLETKRMEQENNYTKFKTIELDHYLASLKSIAKNIVSILHFSPVDVDPKDSQSLVGKVEACGYLDSLEEFETLCDYIGNVMLTAESIARESPSRFDLSRIGFSTNDDFFAHVVKEGTPLTLAEIVAASNIFEFVPKFSLQQGNALVEDAQLKKYCAKPVADFTMVITPKGITWDKKDEFVAMKDEKAAPKRPLEADDEKEPGIKKLKTDTVALATAPAVAKEPVVAPITASVAKK